MISWLSKLLLFLSSYIPLWTILALLHWSDWGVWRWVPILLGVLGGLGLLSLRYWTRTTQHEEIRASDSLRQDGDAVAYIVTYVLPFLTISITGILGSVAVVLLFVMVMLVYVNSGMIYVNPLLAAAGWHAFSVHSSLGAERTILTRKELIRSDGVITAVRVTDSIWWDVGTDRG